MIKAAERLEFSQALMDEGDLENDPISQFELWWQEAISLRIRAADAVYLGTVDKNGHPDGRVVLLKHFDERGMVFFTNYQSQKAQQLENNPMATMTIFWPALERQVRLRGRAEKTSREESEAYFKTRPRGAQLAAWSSPQSQTLSSRAELDNTYSLMEQKFLDQEIPCPPFWGGFRLKPSYFEFWQGRHNRLHDRFCYRLLNNKWEIERLAP